MLNAKAQSSNDGDLKHFRHLNFGFNSVGQPFRVASQSKAKALPYIEEY